MLNPKQKLAVAAHLVISAASDLDEVDMRDLEALHEKLLSFVPEDLDNHIGLARLAARIENTEDADLLDVSPTSH